MEFNYLVEKKRMLNSLGRTEKQCNNVECTACPLSIDNNGFDFICCDFEIEHPLEAIEIVRKWAEEHPRKTRKDVLLEKFPNAKLKEDGVPEACAESIGICTCKCESCTKCWNTEVEE